MTVYLNGEFMAREDAKISVFDRGFMFGDGVYEVTPAYGKQPFRLRQHMERLEKSLAEIRLANPHTQAQWTELTEQQSRLIYGGIQQFASGGTQIVSWKKMENVTSGARL